MPIVASRVCCARDAIRAANSVPVHQIDQLLFRMKAPIFLAIGLLMLILDAEAGLHNLLRFIYLAMNLGSPVVLFNLITSPRLVQAASCRARYEALSRLS